jgi:tetratricopeptide (TPR) repeat protein
LTKKIEINPNSRLPYIKRGKAYQSKREYEKAITDYTKPINAVPKSMADCLGFDEADVSMGEFYKAITAIADFNKLMKMNLHIKDAFYYRGWAYMETGDYERAIADFDKCVELEPYSSAVYASRGQAHDYSGQLDKAILDYSAVIKRKDFYGYYYRGLIYVKLGKKQVALADFEEFLRRSPGLEWIDKVKQEMKKLYS